MLNLFSDETRRNPYPVYDHFRSALPVLHEPQSGLWMVFDYDGVKRVLADQNTFSSRFGPDWMIFADPPRHTKLRALVSQAFTPRSIANLEPRIRELSRELLNAVIDRGEMDLATEFAFPLPMRVIAEMLGIPVTDWPQFQRWNDVLLEMSHTIGRAASAEAASAAAAFETASAEMFEYVAVLLSQRRQSPKDDLLTRLAFAEVDGERLTHHEIVGFFQLLLLAGSETTTNLLNSAVLCFIENPDQLARLKAAPRLLPSAIEEVLRYRSPLQWMYRVPTRDVELHGQVIPAGKLTLAMIGSANHDPKQFDDPGHFDIARDPNPHIAFGHGIHFCLGAPLARLEARIALTELLASFESFELASREPWQPRRGLHVHGPSRLPIRFRATRSLPRAC
jgi:cytochrome P450